MTRIRTLEFLPEIFQTPTNSQFLNATLDQLVNPPVTETIQGFIGSKLGYGINPNDYYVTEPTKVRTDYQLTPGVVFTKENQTTAKDFLTYPGMLDALKLEGSLTQDNSELFESQFYSFDSFTDYDKLVNYNEYYWLKNGPPPVEVSSDTIFKTAEFLVKSDPNFYEITESNETFINPTISLLRGGTYRFILDQNTPFWIQGIPGVTGTSEIPPFYDYRDILGVENNGATSGVLTFTVPAKDAQDGFLLPGVQEVDVVSTIPFANINGKLLSEVQSIDGVTSLNGLKVLFYNTGLINEIGSTQNFYDETNYDKNNNLVLPETIVIGSSTTTDLICAAGYTTQNLTIGQTITFNSPIIGNLLPNVIYYVNEIVSSTNFRITDVLGGVSLPLVVGSGAMPANINQGLYEEGYDTEVNSYIYKVEYVGNPNLDPVIKLVKDRVIPINQKIKAKFGETYIDRNFYKSVSGLIILLPFLSAPLTTLYYQDGSNPNRVGQLQIIESNSKNTVNVLSDIIGQKNYTSKNNIVFTNGLKVTFDGDIVPVNYLTGEYYVEGVGTSINLIPVISLTCPEAYTDIEFIPWDTNGYGDGNYDSNLFVPTNPDYITINRNSINNNAWSRSNRWFHSDVINVTATYNNDPTIVTRFGTYENKAKRPIIEFYPNLKLFDYGSDNISNVDFIDFRTTDAFTQVAGQTSYYPDVAVYTTNTATISATAGASTSTILTVPKNQTTGTFVIGQYVVDSLGVLPTNSYISAINSTASNYVVTISWNVSTTIPLTVNDTITTTRSFADNFSLFEGATILFANDNNLNVRKKVYEVSFSTVVPGSAPLITLIEIPNGEVQTNSNVIILKGNTYEGKSLYYDGLNWILGQQKITINQAPLFDAFNENGVSFSNEISYPGTSFVGTTLFAYGIGTGTDDSILGFPLRFTSVNNIGDISFDISFNVDEFNYVEATTPITKKINTGYIHNYTSIDTYNRELGWQTAAGPSIQYQVFQFSYDPNTSSNEFICDVTPALEDNLAWPVVQVYVNNKYIFPSNYLLTTTGTTTTVQLLNIPDIETIIEIYIYSNIVSKNSYYTIPINLSNNPFNTDILSVNMGDLRSHYESIFINNGNISGKIFGSNNYRDLGNLVPYGNEIIQNSASLVLPSIFLRKQNQSLFNSLAYNCKEYVNYKQLLVDTVNRLNLTQTFTPSIILDQALEIITNSKSNTQSFFWSDMLPSKAAYISNQYLFRNDLNVSIYPLSKIYTFDTANYNGVLVYLLREVQGVVIEQQLIKDLDYTISTTAPTLQITIPLLNNDLVIIKEYNQTYGSFVPNTPSKLGLYPLYMPEIVYDETYINPTWFIKGHDGSYTKLYGEYNTLLGSLIDYRDQALFEFEKRIYNNIKLSAINPIMPNQVIPGYFRQTNLSWNDFIQIYTINFLNWVGLNRIDYQTQFYNKNNFYTYNYRDQQNKLNGQPLLQGNWRGLYDYFYDTSEPNISPWEMLGLTIKPSWWEDRYGPAPYTSDNLVLWQDLAQGINYNNGNPFIVKQAIRPELLSILPVDNLGNLKNPFDVLIGDFDNNLFQRSWIVGDDGPAENAYRRSSNFPFDLVKIYSLIQPSNFFNLYVDLDTYRYSSEFNQYLVNNQNHLVLSDIQVYGNGIAKTSYLNWIVDYEKQYGLDGTNNILNLLKYLDVRLIYRMAGFSDKKFLSFYVEKGTPNDRNASLLIPDESYNLILYDNQPDAKLIYSSVTIQKGEFGYYIFGNSKDRAYFTLLTPRYNGKFDDIKIENLSVRITVDYDEPINYIPYGTLLFTVQDVATFLSSYGAYLNSQGMIFDTTEFGALINWRQMISEFLYWAQTGWEEGSAISLNPSANEIKIDKPNQIVQPLTLHNFNFILNQSFYPININDLAIIRNQTLFSASAQNNGDSLAYGQFYFSNFEHGVVFDNQTLFGDVIYNLITGLKQQRIYVRGTKSAEWDGTVNASGFILNQDNILEWNKNIAYTKGVIVLYKNKYYVSLRKITPSGVFNENDWKLTDYEEIQKGLLPNSSTRAYESSLYYNINKVNLEKDADLLSFSLIGFRPRDYLSAVDLTDITQVNVYKNFIKQKGTKNSLSAFKGANFPQGGIEYEVYENWAIKTTEFGGVSNNNFIEFKLRQGLLTGSPAIVSLTNGVSVPGSQQEVPIYSLFNYNRPITTSNILSTIPRTSQSYIYPNAGYVNFNDVKMSSYYYSSLPVATNSAGSIVQINNFYVRDYVWLANFVENWQVYTWESVGQVLAVKSNGNGTSTIIFNTPHNLSKLDPIAIVNFTENINGYYFVNEVVDLYQVIINLTLDDSFSTLTSQGIGLKFVSQRVNTPNDIDNLNLLNAEFIKNTVWVDNDYDDSWAVFLKSINYQYNQSFTQSNTNKFGTSVAYTELSGFLCSDIDNLISAGNFVIGEKYQIYTLGSTNFTSIGATSNTVGEIFIATGVGTGSGSASQGRLYRYQFDPVSETYNNTQILNGPKSFGKTLKYVDNMFFVADTNSSEPAIYIYNINDTQVSKEMYLLQVINKPNSQITNFGDGLAISKDKNWLYISDIDNNTTNYRQNIYVYRRDYILLNAGYFNIGDVYEITSIGTTDFTTIGAISNEVGIMFVATGVGTGTGTATQVTYKYANIIDGTSFGNNFGKSLATDTTGDVLVVGAPGVTINNLENAGRSYFYQRANQKIEVSLNSNQDKSQEFQLGWIPDNLIKTAISFNSTNDFIELNNVTGININDPILFSGSGLIGSGIQNYFTYYVASIIGNNITIKNSRSTSNIVSLNTLVGPLSVVACVQTCPFYVYVNGQIVMDNNYGCIIDKFYYSGTIIPGDIIEIQDSQFTFQQSFVGENNDRVGGHYGYSTDVNRQGSEIIIGAPFEISLDNFEGRVYRYTNGGNKYGIVIGTRDCNLTTNRKLFINGFLVYLPAGNAESTATVINNAGLPNIAAGTIDNKLYINVINTNIALPNEKLVLSALDNIIFYELGITLFIESQQIVAPHPEGSTRFGAFVKFNEFDSFVVSAPIGSRYEATTFDFTDDENFDNDTIFDNNATQFLDNYPNAGAVYMFDYLQTYNENIDNVGKFIYAQSLNDIAQDTGIEPLYGESLDFNDYKVVVGIPNYNEGKFIVYNNNNRVKDWVPYRKSSEIVNIEKIQNAQIFDSATNNTLVNLDYIDPLQGKLFGAVRENIDYVSNVDPAKYNSPFSNQIGLLWGSKQVGQVWFNTNNVRFVNYHQNDVVYNGRYWGTVFPGSSVEIYTWIESNVPPDQYTGPGIIFDPTLYAIQIEINATNSLVPLYYFWVRNTGLIDRNLGKTLADITLEQYILNPVGSGISYFVPLLSNSFGLYNVENFLNGNNSIFHIGFATGENDDTSHSEFSLIRSNYADDFLPGVPKFGSRMLPDSLYDRFLDSLTGLDEVGNVVPNPYLPYAVQSGVFARPRQSFFYNRFLALKNYLLYANTVMKQFPIVETKPFAFRDFLQVKNPNNSIFLEGQEFDTSLYWEYINWWALGYSDSTKAAFEVRYYADLSTLDVAVNTIVNVGLNINGNRETYRYDGNKIWTRIGLENGTIQFKPTLYNYNLAKFGFGDNFYDTSLYDQYPAAETRYILRALNERIYTEELLIFRNKSLILLFDYIQTETIESQNFLPWLQKTSLVDVSHTIRELYPYEVYKTDNQEFLEGYLNEVKPYHVVIKDYLLKYTGTDVYEGDISDFDLPSQYNPTIEKFVSPELVYDIPRTDYEYLPTNEIWQTGPYNQWYTNRGLSLTGFDDYSLTTLASYVNISSTIIFFDNVAGLPVTGTVLIGNEFIGYSYVDRALNYIGNLQRGLNQSTITDHIPGENVVIDLPGVVVLDSGRAYTSPPKVTAYTDPILYPQPIRQAILLPIMSLDKVVAIRVIDSGLGYATTPSIVIEPSLTVEFASINIDTVFSTITIYTTDFETGDLVQFKVGIDSSNIKGLKDNSYYYIGVLETDPNYIFGLYYSYADAINDNNRVRILSTGNGTYSLNLSAQAFAVTSATPKREILSRLRYDRTSYTSQVSDWLAGVYYGSFFAGRYSNSDKVSSSSIRLQSILPPISSILASARGVVFEIDNITNDQQVTFSSFIRYASETILANNSIKLIPQDGNIDPLDVNPQTASGLTLGFYINMPVKFAGDVGPLIVQNKIYYVNEVLNDFEFTISESVDGPIFALTNYTVSEYCEVFVGEVINTALVTANYPEIRTVTSTEYGTNKIKIPLLPTGSGGTQGFYINIPLEFIGTVFGNIVANLIYYVTTIIDEEHFTVSKTQNPVRTSVYETDSSNNSILVEQTFGFSINDPIIFNEMTIGVGNFVIGQTYKILHLNDTDFTALGATENIIGLEFIATGTGEYFAGSTISGYFYTITILGNTDWNLLANTTDINYVVGDTILVHDPSLVTGSTGKCIQGAGLCTTNYFGNLYAGRQYYIRTILNDTSFTISDEINGSIFEITDQIGSALVTNQKDTEPLVDAQGTMLCNISLPVSPGQVDGQRFYFYNTSSQFVSPALGPNQNLITKTITASLGNGTTTGENKFAIKFDSETLSNFYVNMPIEVNSNQGEASFYGAITSSFGIAYLTVYDIPSPPIGTINIGGLVTGSGVVVGDDARIVNQISGTPGGEGTYLLSNNISPTSGVFNLEPNLDVSDTYYIINYSGRLDPDTNSIVPKLTADCTTTVAELNYILCDSTSQLYIGMPIVFSLVSLGGIVLDTEYFVKNIISSTAFTISTIREGEELTLFTDFGNMLATGESFIQVSQTFNGDSVIISSCVDEVLATQTPQGLQADFDISYILGGYRAIIRTQGSGYAVNNTIKILGTELGGITPNNDLLLTVSGISPIGEITDVICSGTVPGIERSYYLKVYSQNQFYVYSNPLLNVPVSGIDFEFVGQTLGTATNFYSTGTGGWTSDDVVKLSSVADFSINDGINFTGNVIQASAAMTGSSIVGTTLTIGTLTSGEILVGMELVGTDGLGIYVVPGTFIVSNLSPTTWQVSISQNITGATINCTKSTVDSLLTYYITDISTAHNEITISTEPNGPSLTLGIGSGSTTVGKLGSIMFLPEPFYFDASLVKFNNRIYECIVSNNDEEFILGKWQELDQGDRRINAMDRVIGYYQPTANMPGVDLTQIFTGVTYPNSTYYGNPFAPAQQYPLDTVLKDIPFYPTQVNIHSILYNGVNYYGAANISDDYSAILSSIDGSNWSINKLSDVDLSTTDIILGNNVYVMTSRNQATPIFRSGDGINWTTNGYYVPYGSVPFDSVPYDITSLFIAALSLNSVAFGNDIFVAVGEKIVTSDDTYVWRSTHEFETIGWNNATLVNELYGVTYVALNAFTGFIAVGKGQRYDTSSGFAEIIDTGIILTSTDGYTWNEVIYPTNKGLYGVISDSQKIVAVGENGVIYYSYNGTEWFGLNQTQVVSVIDTLNIVNVLNTTGLHINDEIRFNNSFSNIVANTSYFIEEVVSLTQIRIKVSLVSPVLVLTPGTVPFNTFVNTYPITPTLRDIIFANNFYIAVGDQGLIRSSFDGFTWITQNSQTTEDLKGITYKVTATGYYIELDGYPIDYLLTTESDLFLTTQTAGAGLPDQVLFTVVGDNNTIIESTDNGITWTVNALFEIETTLYDVKGEDFTAGYSPEELVSGVVRDNLSMVVTTKPGSNWPVYEYSNVGYNVVSIELTPTNATQTVYSFKDIVQYPAQVALFLISNSNNLCTGLIPSLYTIDWVAETVILNNPLVFFPIPEKLRIDVYEVGNGNQLVRSSTKSDPILLNSVTGWQEIFLNCNYSENIFNGSGVLRPDEIVVDVLATETISATNSIVVSDASKFIVNGIIYFRGLTFGNIVEDTAYYVKTISLLTSSITISDNYNVSTGVAGAVFELIDETGIMNIVIDSGSSSVWSDPYVLHNGTKLALGVIGNVFRTKASNNAFTTSTTAGLIVNSPIKFSSYVFGVLQPLATYYIKQILNGSEFTVSETLVANVAGPVLILTDAVGSASYITSDFAFAIGPNGEGTSLVLSGTYDKVVDYLQYTVFGETEPDQYGYTIPETQVFTATGGISIYSLENFVGGLNPNNAVVEINGLRQNNTFYEIDGPGQSILFYDPPANGSIITITSYSNTQRQYLNTQFGITGSPLIPGATIVIEATIHEEYTYDEVITAGGFIIGQTYQIAYVNDLEWPVSGPSTDFTLVGATTVDVGSLVIGTTYVIQSIGTTDFTLLGAQTNTYGLSFTATATGLVVAGNFLPTLSYTIVSVGTTDFTLIGASSNTPGVTFIATGIGTGDGTAKQGSGYTWEKLFTATGPGTDTGSAVLDGNGFDSERLTVGSLIEVQTYTILELGTTTNNQWNIIAGTNNITSSNLQVGVTYEIVTLGTTNWNACGYIGVPIIGGIFTATSNNAGTGTVDIVYSVGDSFTCINDGYGFGDGVVYGSGYYDGELNYLRCDASSNTNELFINATIEFSTPTLDDLQPIVNYYVTEIWNSKEFVISDQASGPPLTVTNDTGSMNVLTNTIQVNTIVNVNNTLEPEIATSYADETLNETAVMTGSSITGTTLTVGTLTSGTIYLGMVLTGTNVQEGTVITANLSGSGSGSTWRVSANQTVASTTITGIANIVMLSDTLGFIEGQNIEFQSPYILMGTLEIAKQYQIFALGTTTQNQWNTIAGTSGVVYKAGDIITCFNTGVGFGTGVVLLTSFGGISCLGTVYNLLYAFTNSIVIADEFGQIVQVTDSTFPSLIKVIVGGVPSVRITTLDDHNFETNDLVRIDGVLGSVQLNNNTYYVHVINSRVFDVYFTPFNYASTGVNNIVDVVSTYISGGYVWLDTLFTVADTATYSTTSDGNKIYVISNSNFIIGTPVYFSQPGSIIGDTIIGGLTMGEEYFITNIFETELNVPVSDFIIGGTYIIKTLGTTSNANWNTIAGTSGVTYKVGSIISVRTTISATIDEGTADSAPAFTISDTRGGSNVVLSNDYFATFVSQWQQLNVDRLWVTINGLRVPSSSLKLNYNNNLSILYPIEAGDLVIISSMIPNASPNQETYILNVNQINEPVVYRATRYSKTYVTQTLNPMIDVLFVDDVTKISKLYVETSTAPAPINNIYSIGLIAEKTIIASLTVFNNTTNQFLSTASYQVKIVNLSPILEIEAGDYISAGDSLTITTLEGRTILINGEIIQFTSIDFENNALIGLSRGSFGTGERFLIPKYSIVYGLLSSEKLADDQYNQTWNSDVYNVTIGDPLQISNTTAATFLKSVS